MSEEWLPADHGADNRGLQQRVTRGLLWTIVDNWGRQILFLLVFIVLARLLQQPDFGLVALAGVFVTFAQILVDQGLSDAIVQRGSLTRAHIDTAFWVSMVTGAILTVVGIVLAIPIAALLNEPELEPILQALSLTFVLTALTSVQMAILRRELAFRSLALRGLFAITGGGVVGIGMAFLGYGAWALVGQQLTQATLSVAVLWAVSPWRPGRSVSRQHFSELFSFGINIVGGDVLTFLSRNTDYLLIGAFRTTFELGLYAVAFRILESTATLLLGIARKVAFPTFSRLQGDRERMQRAFFRVTRISGVVIIPGYLGLALIAPELTVVLFGETWRESGPVAQLLFLVGPNVAIQGFSGSLYNAAGYPNVLFRFRLMTTITNVVGFAIAVPFGILYVAAAFSLRAYLLMPLNLYWLRKYVGIDTREYLLQLRGIAISTAAMAAGVVIVKLAIAGRVSEVLLVATEVVVGAIIFFPVLWLVERRLLRDLIELASQALPGTGRAQRRLRRQRAGGDLQPAAGDAVPAVSGERGDDV